MPAVPAGLRQPLVLDDARDALVQCRPCWERTTVVVGMTLARVDATLPRVQALLLAPTRELAQQLARVVTHEAARRATRVHVVGETTTPSSTMRHDARVLLGTSSESPPPHVLVGTPGRVGALARAAAAVASVHVVVLDDADEMLARGFRPPHLQREILAGWLARRAARLVVVAAASSPAVREFVVTPAPQHVRLLTASEESASAPRSLCIAVASSHDDMAAKFEWLMALIQRETGAARAVLVLTATRGTAEWLHRSLVSHACSAELLHGEQTLTERAAALDRFEQRETRVLVSTDAGERCMRWRTQSDASRLLVVRLDTTVCEEVCLPMSEYKNP